MKRTNYPMAEMNQLDDDILTRAIDEMSIQDVENINPNLSETLIGKEMHRLSMEERDDVLHDIHGVADIVEETPELVENCLHRLDLELSSIPYKPAYEQALVMSPSFILDGRLCLMFLRAARFEPANAARRMVAFFEHKLNLFGPDKLTKQIRIDDLDDDTIACLETGYMQILPGRDRAGRAVLMALTKFRSFRSELSLVRSLQGLSECIITTITKYCFSFVLFGTLQQRPPKTKKLRRGELCLSRTISE
jgi:hypothetical protein